MATKYFSLSNLSNGMKEQEKTLAQALAQLGLYKLYSSIGKTNTVESFANFDYEQKNELTLNSLMKYCAEYAGIGSDVESLKSPATRRDKDFSKKFFGILQVATAPVIAEVVNQAFDHIAEVRNAGWGDSFLFRIGSPALFQVNLLARGINRGAAQRIYDENLTLIPTNREVTVSMDWYQIAAGRYDMGDYLFRVGRSFAADMSQMAYNGLDATFANLPTPLKYSGPFDTDTLDTMVQRLQALNGQAIYGFGSLGALSKVLPANDWLKIPLAEEWDTLGFVGQYRRIRFMLLEQNMIPSTIGTSMDFGISQNRIYLMPMSAEKPMKVGIEGNTMVYETDAETSADNTIFVTTQMSYGAVLATANRYGIYEISA